MYTDRKLKEYNEREERFRLAVAEATANKSASINSIANKYRVSRTTLSRRIHGFKNTRNSHEKQQKFTNEEENVIVAQIQEVLRQSDHVPAKKEILIICERVLKDKYKDRAPEEGETFFKVGKNWIDRFLERHNDKLMINGETTLSEYYKSEFLTRKKLRSDRGYKTSTSTTPLSEQSSLQYGSNGQINQQYTYQAPSHDGEHHQPHLNGHVDIPPPRLPYQGQPSQSDSFVYQSVEHPVPGGMPQMNVYPGQPYGVGQQPPYNQEQQWAYGIQQPKQSISHVMYSVNQPSFSYGNGSQQFNGQKTSVGGYASYYQPPVKSSNSPVVSNVYTEQGGNPQFQTFNGFSFSQQYPQNHQEQANQNNHSNSSNQQQPRPLTQSQAQSQANTPTQSDGTSHGPGPASSGTEPSESNQLVRVSTNGIDSLQFYQGQRFQYESARQRILKELERENIDVDSVVKLVNLSFTQMERDLNGSNNHTYGGY